jgi:hypothetical protein
MEKYHLEDKANTKHNIRRDVKQIDGVGTDHINPYMLASVNCMVVNAFKDTINLQPLHCGQLLTFETQHL